MAKQATKPDFTSGKILKNLISFAIPMAIATLLQIFFNAADIAIVGQFAGSQYQAAVGATSSTVHLIVNLFIGISIGANVAMSHAFGAKDEEKQRRVVHTAMATAFASGFITLFIGIVLSHPILSAIKTPDSILKYSVLYMQIYFLGAPALMIYNFGASLLRAIGETKKPLYYLLVSGLLNLIINVVTVVFFHWHVVGVALGTTISQYVSAIWIVLDLSRAKDSTKYTIKHTRFYKAELKKILYIGVPMGVSSCLFSFSNLSIQSSVNAYGDVAIAGNTVSSNVETMIDAFTGSVEKAVVTIVGQNMGAKKPQRLHRIIGAGAVACLCCEVVYITLTLTAGNYVCMLFNRDSIVVEWALKRLMIMSLSHFCAVLMLTYGAALRGMGYSMFPMLINLVFTCLVRIAYIFLIYANFETQTIQQVYIIYPITWIMSGIMQTLAFYLIAKPRAMRQMQK